MCLIPRQVLDEIGLSLPLFLKWDDSEFGLRAKEAGYPTVSFPGAAVWHVPWTDKNDALDWQSYFHQRNRFVAALLHSPYQRGGRMVQESFNHQIKHLVSMQYSTVALRHKALEDVLAGPGVLHDDLPTKLAEVRPSSSRSPTPSSRPTATPSRRCAARSRRAGVATTSTCRARWQQRFAGADVAAAADDEAAGAVAGVSRERAPGDGRQVVPPRPGYDSAIVSMPDGNVGRALPARPGDVPRPDHARPSRSTARLRREWPRLAAEYRQALGDVTSPQTWEKTFAPWLDGGVDGQ